MNKIVNKLKNMFARIYLDKKRSFFRKVVKNKNISIISSNCIAGTIYHDLNHQFLSPTINLFINAFDFIKLCNNLEYYMNFDLKEVSHIEKYPIGMIKDITIHFLHYSSFREAKKKWNARKMRINYKNIRVVMVDNDHFSIDMIDDFNKIPYKKVLFSSKKLNIKNVYQLTRFENKKMVGILTGYSNFKGLRYYEEGFNLVKFLN